jgi:ribosomal protein S18 acetylase RimI-like enzyme
MVNDGVTDADLYVRGVETLIASWAAYARGADGASVRRLPGVAVAVFPNGPERAVYNNALLNRGLQAGLRAGAVDAMEAAYAAAGISRFAAWVHERDAPMRGDLERRGYVVDETTRAMGMGLHDIRPPRTDVPIGPADWSEYVRFEGLSADFLRGADHAAFHLRVARLDDEIAAAALAYDFEGDCGIYNVSTAEHARRRGLATALTVRQAYDALTRGCVTASLQSTPMAERVYAAVGFHDLGRILEYAPCSDGIAAEAAEGTALP